MFNWIDEKRGRERGRKGGRHGMNVITEHRSWCRSVEAARRGSDTKTALVQTDKRVCLSVCLPPVEFHPTKTLFVCFFLLFCHFKYLRYSYQRETHDCCALLVQKCSTQSRSRSTNIAGVCRLRADNSFTVHEHCRTVSLCEALVGLTESTKVFTLKQWLMTVWCSVSFCPQNLLLFLLFFFCCFLLLVLFFLAFDGSTTWFGTAIRAQ